MTPHCSTNSFAHYLTASVLLPPHCLPDYCLTVPLPHRFDALKLHCLVACFPMPAADCLLASLLTQFFTVPLPNSSTALVSHCLVDPLSHCSAVSLLTTSLPHCLTCSLLPTVSMPHCLNYFLRHYLVCSASLPIAILPATLLPRSPTASLPYYQPHLPTCPLLHFPTASLPCGLTAPLHHLLNTAQFHCLLAPLPHSPTSSLLLTISPFHCPTASLPYGLTAPLPHCFPAPPA